jgi:hypothetical protein
VRCHEMESAQTNVYPKGFVYPKTAMRLQRRGTQEKKNRGQPIRVESRQRIQHRTCLYDRKRPASNESHSCILEVNAVPTAEERDSAIDDDD